MRPLFFPFTYVRNKDAKFLSTLFEGFYFLTTSLRDNFAIENPHITDYEGVEPIFMDDDELQPVLETLKEYRNWAMLNSGTPDSLKTFFRKQPYFTSDTGVANIRSEINRRSKSKILSENNQGNDGDRFYDRKQSFLNSLLFLRLAHENDAEHDSIEHRLQSVLAGEKELFLKVKGGEENMGGEIPNRISVSSEYDPGAFMTEKRLYAWMGVLDMKKNHCNRDEPLVLVTINDSIIEYLHSIIDENISFCDIQSLVCLRNYRVDARSFRQDNQDKYKSDIDMILDNAVSGSQIIKKNTDDLIDNNSIDHGSLCNLDMDLYKVSEKDLEILFRFPLDKDSGKSSKQLSKRAESCGEHFNNVFLCLIKVQDKSE